jgi:predicted phage tail protein
MRMKTRLRGALVSDGKFRMWTGIPVGVAVTYAAGKFMPDFSSITNNWLYPLPYAAPAAALGLLALLSPKAKRFGYGVLGSTAAYYLYAAISNMTAGTNAMPEPYKDFTKSGEQPPYVSETPMEGAPVAVVY